MMPLQFDEFAPCLKWWPKRKANGQAWRVGAEDVLKKAEDGSVTVNLDIKNPSARQDLEPLPLEQLVASIIDKEQRILALMSEIKTDLKKKP